MLPEDVSISWNKEAGAESSENFLSANDAPVIYKRGNDGTRCTVTLRIPKASQVTVVSNARSCETYELDALGRQDYLGCCKGLLRGPDRWELTLAGKGRDQSFKLLLCGLSPADRFKLWGITMMKIEPLPATHFHHSKDTNLLTPGTSGQAQMEGIREILRLGTESAGLDEDADPKRRFMHALASAALQRNDQDNTKQSGKDQEMSGHAESLGLNTAASAAVKAQEAKANGHDSTAGINQQEDSKSSKHFNGGAQMDSPRFIESIEGILQRQLGRFEQRLASVCDAALARFGKQLDMIMGEYEAQIRPGNVSGHEKEGT